MQFTFITTADLELHIQERLLTANAPESTLLPSKILIGLEKAVIQRVKASLNSRYDMELAFAKTGEKRNGLLLEIVVKMVLYKLVRRNAARKVPEDYRDDYKEAKADLMAIQKGEIYPGLPEYVTQTGAVQDKPLYGNSTNEDNYI